MGERKNKSRQSNSRGFGHWIKGEIFFVRTIKGKILDVQVVSYPRMPSKGLGGGYSPVLTHSPWSWVLGCTSQKKPLDLCKDKVNISSPAHSCIDQYRSSCVPYREGRNPRSELGPGSWHAPPETFLRNLSRDHLMSICCVPSTIFRCWEDKHGSCSHRLYVVARGSQLTK